jgi:hypothetical protein
MEISLFSFFLSSVLSWSLNLIHESTCRLQVETINKPVTIKFVLEAQTISYWNFSRKVNKVLNQLLMNLPNRVSFELIFLFLCTVFLNYLD